jgi:predicted ester cyclase
MSTMTRSIAGTVEKNRALGRLFFAEQDRLRGGPGPELCAPDYRARLGSNPPVDRAGHEAFARAFYAAFEDLRHDVEQVLADEDGVVVRFLARGTHGAPFFGIPPSHRPIDIPAHVSLRVRDDKVTELFGVFDEAGLLRQIGTLPSG